MNSANLKPIRSKDEARTLGSKGGKRSGEVRREKKMFQQAIQRALDGEYNVKGSGKLKGTDAIVTALINRAVKYGDVSAATFIRDTIGEKPTEHMQLETPVEVMQAYEKAAEQLKGE